MKTRAAVALQALGVTASLIAIVLALSPSLAVSDDTMIEISPVNVTSGAEFSHGICPCFRWSVDVQLASGEIETRNFLISSDALFQVAQRYGMMDGELASRLYTVGAVEALWKGGHLGLGFTGVTVGNDLDQGYTDILRTGLYIFANIVRTDALRLDIRTGYEFEQKRTNFGPLESHHSVPASLVFDWRSGNWSGDISATMGLDLNDPGWESMHYCGSASVEYKVLDVWDIEAALGLRLAAEHEPDREEYGLEPTGYSGMVFMRLGWSHKWGGR